MVTGNIYDNGINVGIGTNNPNTKLRVAGSLSQRASGSTAIQEYKNIVTYSLDNYGNGGYVVKTPFQIGTSYEMAIVHVKGYGYGDSKLYDFKVIFYDYGPSSAPIGYSLVDLGNDGSPKYLAKDATNYLQVCFGNTTDVNNYYYRFTVDCITTRNDNDYSQGWRMYQTTGTNFGFASTGIYTLASPINFNVANNYVGIGKTNPTCKLDVAGTIRSSTNEIYGFGVSDNVSLRASSSVNVLGIYTSNVERLRLAANGYFGVGTDNPSTLLSIGGAGSTSVLSGLTFGADSQANLYRISSARIKTDGNFTIDGQGGGSTSLVLNRSSTSSENGMAFNTAGVTDWYFYVNDATSNLQIQRLGENDATPRVRFDGSNSNVLFNLGGGNVGVGTDSPNYKLDVIGSVRASGELISEGNNTRLSLFRNNGINYFDWASGQSLYFSTQTSVGGGGRSTLMSITSGGNVGIGTVTPNGRLHVVSPDSTYAFSVAGATKGVRFNINSTATYIQGVDNTLAGSYQSLVLGGSDLYFQTNGLTNAVYIDSSGDVGINTTSPTSKLHVIETTATGTRIQLGVLSSSTLMNAGSTNDLLILNVPYGDNPAGASNIGAKWGIKFIGSTDALSNSLGKTSAIYAVSEDTLGYNRGTSLAFYTNQLNDQTYAERMRIYHNGNIGIGVTNPSNKVQISGGGISFTTSTGLAVPMIGILPTNIAYVGPYNSPEDGNSPALVLFNHAASVQQIYFYSSGRIAMVLNKEGRLNIAGNAGNTPPALLNVGPSSSVAATSGMSFGNDSSANLYRSAASTIKTDGSLEAAVGIISPTITSLSGNIAATGSTLDAKINTLSGYSNATFATITNLAATGSTLDTKINSLSGYSNANFATILNLAATGSVLDTKINSLSGYAGNTFLSGVGVSNYVPRWSGTKLLVTGSIYDLGTGVGIGTTSPGAKLDVVGTVRMPVIRQSTTLYAGTDIIDDNSTRTVYFNIPEGGNNPARYFKVARIKITSNYQNVSLNGYFTTTNSALHVGFERKVEFDFIAYAATNPGAPQVTYLKRGPDTTNVLVYAVPDGGGAGTTYYDVYIKNGWYNDTNGELAIRVGYSSAVTVWQAGLDSGTSAPVDTLVNPNSNYAFDTAGNVGIGSTNPAYKLDVNGSAGFTNGITVNADASSTSYFVGANGTRPIIFQNNTASAYDFGFKFTDLNTFTLVGGNTLANPTTDLVSFTYDGKVGIGITNPLRKLHITSSDNQLIFISGSTAGTWMDFQSSTSNLWSAGADGTNGFAIFNRTTNSNAVTVANGGNVGIGTTNPAVKLHITNSGTVSSIATVRLVGSTGNNAGSQIEFYKAQTPEASIGLASAVTGGLSDDLILLSANPNSIVLSAGASGISVFKADGKVGIGTINPQTLLSLGGLGSTSAASGLTFGGDAQANLYRSAEDTIRTDGSLVVNGNFNTNTTTVTTLNINAGTLPGIPAGSTITGFTYAVNNGNVSQINLVETRFQTGSDWTTASTRIQKRTDVTNQAYIEFNPSGASYGMALGVGANSNVEALRILSNGNVGIGTTNPSQKLEVSGNIKLTDGGYIYGDTTAPYLRLNQANGTYLAYSTTSVLALLGSVTTLSAGSNYLGLITNGSERFRISSNGNVGIGTTNPVSALHIYSGNGTSQIFNQLQLTNMGTPNQGDIVGIGFAAGESTVYGVKGSIGFVRTNNYGRGALTFYTNNTAGTESVSTGNERVRIQADGNVGIGTNNALNKLSVIASNTTAYYNRSEPVAVFQGTSPSTILVSVDGNVDGYYAELKLGNAQSTYYPYSAYIRGIQGAGIDYYRLEFGTANGSAASTRMTIASSGNVGLGTTNPITLLSIGGPGSTSAASGITFGADASSNLYRDSSASIRTDGGFLAASRIRSLDYIQFNSSLYPNSFTNPIDINIGNVAANAWQSAIRINPGSYVGIGTTQPSGKLHIVSTVAGETVLRADGTNGTLFSVTDDLSDSLMSVNNSAGLPVLEVFADDRVVAGQYGSGDFVLVNNKVGIGNTNPSFKLDVNGSLGINASTSDTNWPFVVSDNSSAGSRYGLNKAGSMGFNYADAYAQLQLLGANGAYIDFTNSVGGDSNARLIYYAGARLDLTYGFITNGTISLNSNGIGIGTTSPVVALDVVGPIGSFPIAAGTTTTGVNLRLRNSDSNLVLDIGGNGGNGNWLQSTSRVDLSLSYPLLFNPNGGNVGIGLTNPSAKLHVRGEQVYLYNDLNTNNTFFYVRNSGAGNAGIKMKNLDGEWTIIANDRLRFIDDDAGVERLSILSNGKVGIGTASPTTLLSVGGPGSTSAASGLTFGGDAEANLYRSAEDTIKTDGSLIVAGNVTATNLISGNGTANYVTKWNGTKSVANSQIFDDGTYVGINTAVNTTYRLQVNGSFAATTKSFDIVHPTISGKRLTYASLEGPENGVYYRGQNNNNEIILPHYWSGLVHDDSITVNLTAVGRRKDGKIRNYSVDQIGHNKVYIYTDSNDNIYNYYYTIFAERKDVSKLVIERDME